MLPDLKNYWLAKSASGTIQSGLDATTIQEYRIAKRTVESIQAIHGAQGQDNGKSSSQPLEASKGKHHAHIQSALTMLASKSKPIWI